MPRRRGAGRCCGDVSRRHHGGRSPGAARGPALASPLADKPVRACVCVGCLQPRRAQFGSWPLWGSPAVNLSWRTGGHGGWNGFTRPVTASPSWSICATSAGRGWTAVVEPDTGYCPAAGHRCPGAGAPRSPTAPTLSLWPSWPPKTVLELRGTTELGGRDHPQARSGVAVYACPFLAQAVTGPGAPAWSVTTDLGSEYLGFLSQGAVKLAAIIELLARCQAPVLVHCTAGKDPPRDHHRGRAARGGSVAGRDRRRLPGHREGAPGDHGADPTRADRRAGPDRGSTDDGRSRHRDQRGARRVRHRRRRSPRLCYAPPARTP